MQKVNHDKVEKFYDVLNESTTLLLEQQNQSYMDALIESSGYILDGDVINDDLNQDAILSLKQLYTELENKEFNQEEIRKAFQLCLLTGFKHQKTGMSTMTPDSMGVLVAYLIDQLYPSNKQIDVIDATVGTGNLMVTVLNHAAKTQFGALYGIDLNYQHLEIALMLAQLTDHEIELVHQDSRKKLIIPQTNLIIADLPTGYEKNYDLKLPYQIVNNLMQYNLPGGYFIYLIPNDFFERDGQEDIKQTILTDTFIHALITLPETMFKTQYSKKSILILRKRGADIEPTKEILVLNFPSFKDQIAVKKAMDQLNVWFNKTSDNGGF